MSTELIIQEYSLAEYTAVEQFVTSNGKLVVGIPHSDTETGDIVLLLPYLVLPKTPLPQALRSYNSSPLVLFYTSCLESRALADRRLEYRYLTEILSHRQGDLCQFLCMGEATVNEYCRRRIELEDSV